MLDLRRSKVVTKFFHDLVGLAYDPGQNSLLLNILVIASILLQFASGYTTYMGLKQYVPWFIALLVTIPIQGLLFAASWRIAQTLSARNISFSPFLLYLVTMCVSVFFSYSALLDHIYDEPRRKDERSSITRNETELLIRELQRKISEHYQETTAQLNISVSKWAQDVQEIFVQELTKKQNRYQAARNKLAGLQGISTNEEKRGGSIYLDSEGHPRLSNRGKPLRSPPGIGPILLDIQKEIVQVQSGEVDPLKEELAQLDKIPSAFGVAAEFKMEEATLQDVANNFCSLLSQVGGEASNRIDLCTIPNSIMNTFLDRENAQDYLSGLDEFAESYNPTDISSVRAKLISLISTAPHLSEDERKVFLDEVNRVGGYQTSTRHYFEFSIFKILELNLLAIGSLFIAIVLDGLILICGILGAKPSSFLVMKRSSDLDDIQEQALEAVLALKIENPQVYRIPIHRRMVEFISSIRIAPELCEDGYAGYLLQQDLEQLKLQAIIPLLVSLGHATRETSGELRIVIASRLIIWMADRIYSDKTANDLHQDIFNDLNYLKEEK